MAKPGASARTSPSKEQAVDAVAVWRRDYQRLQEQHDDLRRQHEELQGRYRTLHAGYKTCLDRLYRVMGTRAAA